MSLEIVQILAAGTFGHVVIVRDTTNDRLLAAKVLKAHHLDNSKLVRRVNDEAALLARLDHPNIVRSYGVRWIDDRPVVLLEWVRGASLDSLLTRFPGGLPLADACAIIETCARTLEAAWDAPDPRTGSPLRVIHRDFKPSNVVLAWDGVVKVLDFGIAKSAFPERESETITVVLGAHGYISPERLDGAHDSPAGDVYALGASLYELVSGRRMLLSLTRSLHDERLSRDLMRAAPEGAGVRALSELTGAIGAMCAYDPDARPTYPEVVEGLRRLQGIASLVPDLPRLARHSVWPVLEDLCFASPVGHPSWPELAFLEQADDPPSTVAPRRIDQEVRAVLERDDWFDRRAELRGLLGSDPSWSAAPLLELLDRLTGSGPRLRRPRSSPEERDQLVFLLELLRARPVPEVRERARSLARHGDPEVSELARQVAHM
jgi:serine/threonine protein kinase